MSHSHTIVDPGHSHGIVDPGHTHGTVDPGHSHDLVDLLDDICKEVVERTVVKPQRAADKAVLRAIRFG
jgi:hypothetical protein